MSRHRSNDLRVPLLERKGRKFLACFAEDVAIKTLEGRPVLKDFDDVRKRFRVYTALCWPTTHFVSTHDRNACRKTRWKDDTLWHGGRGAVV